MSVADIVTNVLDLVAYFLVAPAIIGESRMTHWYNAWLGVNRYLYAKPSILPFMPRMALIFFGTQFAAALMLLAAWKWMPQPSVYVTVTSVSIIIPLSLIFIGAATMIFDIEANRKGVIRVMAVLGTGLFVVARSISIVKALGLSD